MTDNLSPNEVSALDALPATTNQLVSRLGISKSYAYDLTSNLEDKGYELDQNDEGEYIIVDGPETGSPDRQEPSPSEKAQITREFREKVAKVHDEVAEELTDIERPNARVPESSADADIILHRTDDHFGEEITDDSGTPIFDSRIAESRVREYFADASQFVQRQRDSGMEIDTAHLLIGGDVVTNESIYEGQAHEIDENLYEQMDRATDVYFEEIAALSDDMETVQVVCQAGNHGELRAPNSSTAANADDIVFMMLEKMIAESSIDNVNFVTSTSSYYVNFEFRGWRGHLRHGHDASLEHIGTSAGEQRWLTWLAEHEFDAAFRGHYHTLKEEPVAGRPVHMGGALPPTSEFEESRAISGRAGSAYHLATDDAPTKVTRRVWFDN